MPHHNPTTTSAGRFISPVFSDIAGISGPPSGVWIIMPPFYPSFGKPTKMPLGEYVLERWALWGCVEPDWSDHVGRAAWGRGREFCTGSSSQLLHGRATRVGRDDTFVQEKEGRA